MIIHLHWKPKLIINNRRFWGSADFEGQREGEHASGFRTLSKISVICGRGWVFVQEIPGGGVFNVWLFERSVRMRARTIRSHIPSWIRRITCLRFWRLKKSTLLHSTTGRISLSIYPQIFFLKIWSIMACRGEKWLVKTFAVKGHL